MLQTADIPATEPTSSAKRTVRHWFPAHLLPRVLTLLSAVYFTYDWEILHDDTWPGWIRVMAVLPLGFPAVICTIAIYVDMVRIAPDRVERGHTDEPCTRNPSHLHDRVARQASC